MFTRKSKAITKSLKRYSHNVWNKKKTKKYCISTNDLRSDYFVNLLLELDFTNNFFTLYKSLYLVQFILNSSLYFSTIHILRLSDTANINSFFRSKKLVYRKTFRLLTKTPTYLVLTKFKSAPWCIVELYLFYWKFT